LRGKGNEGETKELPQSLRLSWLRRGRFTRRGTRNTGGKKGPEGEEGVKHFGEENPNSMPSLNVWRWRRYLPPARGKGGGKGKVKRKEEGQKVGGG